eukprot:Pgem_evm1s16625
MGDLNFFDYCDKKNGKPQLEDEESGGYFDFFCGWAPTSCFFSNHAEPDDPLPKPPR